MANYANLQEAINAETSNMKQEEYRSAELSLFYIDHWIPHYANLDYKTSGQYYHTISLGDTGCEYVIAYKEYSYEESIAFLSEHGYINGHYFTRIRVTLPTRWGYGHIDTIVEVFFLDTCQLYVRNIQPDAYTSYLKTSTEQVDISYTSGEYSEFVFTPSDRDNGVGWSAEEGVPDLPDIPDPSEAPTPTIIYDFQKNVRYRAKVRTWYLPPTGAKRSIDSNPSEEFTGTDTSGFYTTLKGLRIDKKTREVWSGDKTDLKATVQYEGDLYGLHYKAYACAGENYGVAVITGVQTDGFSSVTEWPFMNQSSPPYYVTMYCDAKLTDMDWFFWNNDRFGNFFEEFILGPNGEIDCEISSLAFRYPSDWGHMTCIDNISKTRIACDASGIFRGQHLMLEGPVYAERLQRFFNSLDFYDTYYNSMFRDGGLYSPFYGGMELDFSFLRSSYATDISYLLYRCDVIGTVDLRNLMISSMQYAFASCDMEEVLFKSTGAGNLAVTGLSYAFQYASNLKRVDLTGFTTSSAVRPIAVFNGCTSLEFIDMTGLELSCYSSSDINNFLTGCTNLKEFGTPQIWGGSIPALPITMYDSEGNEYTTVPSNKTLYATNPVG
ncbi:MAG: hypothetical protein J6Y02_08440 [Pseudobutyrivibrio sp.]|nr:hypothetical protein [Pseudobutyrivibrio sp.]